MGKQHVPRERGREVLSTETVAPPGPALPYLMKAKTSALRTRSSSGMTRSFATGSASTSFAQSGKAWQRGKLATLRVAERERRRNDRGVAGNRLVMFSSETSSETERGGDDERRNPVEEPTSSAASAFSEKASDKEMTPAEAVRASKSPKEQVRFSVTSAISEDDMQAMQKYAQSEGVERIVRGALIEARLIEWPGPPEALVTTLIVIVMVSGSAGVLFLVNGILAQVSELLFYK